MVAIVVVGVAAAAARAAAFADNVFVGVAAAAANIALLLPSLIRRCCLLSAFSSPPAEGVALPLRRHRALAAGRPADDPPAHHVADA